MNPKLAKALVLVCLVAAPAAAVEEGPAAYCRRVGTYDMRRPLPASLVPAVNVAFGTDLTVESAVQRTSWRCMNGRLMVCVFVANRHCGKAKAQVIPTPEAVVWCKANPDSPFIPSYVTGRSTIWKWRCNGHDATIEGPAFTVDARGFTAENWKALEPPAKNLSE